MADGYVVAEKIEDTLTLTQFWDGTTLVAEFQDALFFTDRNTTRAIFGSLQAQFSEREFCYVQVQQSLVLNEAGYQIQVITEPEPEPAPTP